MDAQQKFRLRIHYCKQGRLVYLSHLEVARALERAVRRARLPYAISQGYSPHMKIAFGSALPVGVGGEDEICDLQLVSYIAPDKALKALRESSCSDLMVHACAYIEPHAKAASVALPISTYCAKFSMPPESFVLPETITIVRKKKEKTLVVKDFLVDQPRLDNDAYIFSLEAKPTGSLRTDLLIKTALRDYNLSHPDVPLRLISLIRQSQRESS
ncbi:MAG: TIGR03936 family radical SAM-associated protein [Eggerthellaceae bacterium]|jgi:radical SAM-linked protein